jgi:ubiquinone/menaquinone biosynthesis C-methylase UbiE
VTDPGREEGGRTFTADEAKRFYDRFGRKQDLQAFYEDPAVGGLIAHGDFAHATAVFEFGCGTGRLAERLLRSHLPEGSTYLGVDISSTMVGLARDRLRPWSKRAQVQLSSGSTLLTQPPQSVDRFVATYVLDLLSIQDIRTLLAEARRILRPDGLLCLVSLTEGTAPLAALVSWAWKRLYSLSPSLLGGCRPVRLGTLLALGEWRIRYSTVVTTWGISSEILVAEVLGLDVAAT